MATVDVSIVMGSSSDYDVMIKTTDILEIFGVSFEMRIFSAHRTPVELVSYVKNSDISGVKIFVAGAGMSAALPGVIAAHTLKPVIGVPIAGKTMGGLDSLLSMVQMPKGIPVATMSLNGAENAGFLSVQILALSNSELTVRLDDFRRRAGERVLERNNDFVTGN
jgi:5-(carboxyamino)imidazole ribonucleotide mutase